jgi:hypothetical protein
MSTEDGGADGDEKSERAAERRSAVACCRRPEICCVLALQTRGTHHCQWPRGVLHYRSGYWTRACSTCAHVRVRPLPPEGEQPGLQQPLRTPGVGRGIPQCACETHSANGTLLRGGEVAPLFHGRQLGGRSGALRPFPRDCSVPSRGAPHPFGCCVSTVMPQLLHVLRTSAYRISAPFYAGWGA